MTCIQDQISKWKDIYTDIYQINIGDREGTVLYSFIFRKIGRKEYNDLLLNHVSQSELQERVCNTCVLSPEYDFSTGLGGLAESLSNAIIQTSNLLENQGIELLNYYREEMQHFDYQVDCIIHEAFPEFKIEEISNWPIDKSMYYLSRAEYILRELKGVPLAYIDNANTQQQQANQYQHTFTNTQSKPTNGQRHYSDEKGENGELSEAELMEMLAENEAKQGRSLNYKKDQPDVFPELSWFKAEEELTGDFD